MVQFDSLPKKREREREKKRMAYSVLDLYVHKAGNTYKETHKKEQTWTC